jgi:MoaA/NifB/PqqE/SkfB family radical SAM enzyme
MLSEDIIVPEALRHMRRFPLDGALLLFDRDTGVNALCEGDETAGLRQLAPRMVQFGITNACNLACTFCSRDLSAKSQWTSGSAFEILSQLCSFGVLEVAFGGGEPWVFPGFADLVVRLYQETSLAVNLTTNGLHMTKQDLRKIHGKYGQIRLSLYDNNDWRNKVAELADQRARFGVNYLVTPERLTEIEATVLELCSLGCTDILLLSYNGPNPNLHLDACQTKVLSETTTVLAKALTHRCQIKLDVCWGERMEGVPRLFRRNDCGAGREFLVLTSDKNVQPCSFHQLSIPFHNAMDVMRIWNARKSELLSASSLPGCARVDGFGLGELKKEYREQDQGNKKHSMEYQ